MNQVPMKLYSLAFVAFACCIVLATAQQQQPGAVVLTPIAAPVNTTCASTTSKPSPQATTYHFGTCIVAKFAAYFSIGQGKYVELKNGVVSNLSKCETNATLANGPQLIVDFDCGQIQFVIDKQVNSTGIFVKAVNGKYTIGNATVSFSNSTALFHTTQSGHYYKCKTEQPIISSSTADTILMISDFAYEAYRTVPGTDFYQVPEECALDSSQVSDLVRIGVGICLVALVVIVLVAYFVGRRRWSERSSYESV